MGDRMHRRAPVALSGVENDPEVARDKRGIELHCLERRHSAQDFASVVSGEPDRRQLPGQRGQVNLVRLQGARAAVGNRDGSIDVAAEIGDELRPDPQEMMREALRRRDASPDPRVERLVRQSTKRVADRRRRDVRHAGDDHPRVEPPGDRNADRDVRREVARQRAQEGLAKLRLELKLVQHRLRFPSRRDEIAFRDRFDASLDGEQRAAGQHADAPKQRASVQRASVAGTARRRCRQARAAREQRAAAPWLRSRHRSCRSSRRDRGARSVPIVEQEGSLTPGIDQHAAEQAVQLRDERRPSVS